MNKYFPYIHLSKIPFLRIIHRLGYPTIKHVKEKDKAEINSWIDKALTIWQPKGMIHNEKIIRIENSFIQCEKIKIPSKDLVKLFGKCTQISFLAVTAGMEVVKLRDELLKTKNLKDATLLDAILSEITDSLAEHLNNYILKISSLQRYELTRRFSPGYGDLSLSFQKNLLNLIGAKKIEIYLNENFLMKPEKSITALVGWIKK